MKISGKGKDLYIIELLHRDRSLDAATFDLEKQRARVHRAVTAAQKSWVGLHCYAGRSFRRSMSPRLIQLNVRPSPRRKEEKEIGESWEEIDRATTKIVTTSRKCITSRPFSSSRKRSISYSKHGSSNHILETYARNKAGEERSEIRERKRIR